MACIISASDDNKETKKRPLESNDANVATIPTSKCPSSLLCPLFSTCDI